MILSGGVMNHATDGCFQRDNSLSLHHSDSIYYVDQNNPNASDSNPGTEDLPWLTIQKAADTLEAGDTVYIKEGVYNEQVIPKNSGEPGQYISYIGYPGDKVVINGRDIVLPDDLIGLFYISDESYIRVSNVNITNVGHYIDNAGILVYNSHHIIIDDNYIYNTTSSGIGIWESSDIIVEGNKVILACNDGEEECITISATSNFEVRNNDVYNSGPGTLGGEGIDVKEGSHDGRVHGNKVYNINRVGIYIDAWDKHTYNVDVYQNIVYNCRDYGFAVASERGGLLEDVRIYNNIVYGNSVCGIGVTSWGGVVFRHPMQDIEIINNIFYDNGRGDWGGGVSIENGDAEDVIIRNNICSQNLLFQIQVEVDIPSLKVDHNLIDGYRGYDDEIYGDDYVEGDPLFINPIKGDFHLMKGSPAIDNGSSIAAPIDDFDGNYRPHMKGYDIGAFEYPRTRYYGVDTIDREDFSFLKNYFKGNVAGVALECNIEKWENTLREAEKNDIKLIIWPIGHGHQYTPWKWNGTDWDISEGLEVLEYAENYVTNGGKALLAILMSHEPFWNDGNPFTTDQMKQLYSKLKKFAPHVKLYVAFGCLSCFDENPNTRIENGIADIAGIWLHCFGGMEGNIEDALERIDRDYELIEKKNLDMQLFFAIQTFGIKGTKYRMPSASEMLEFGTMVFEKNKLDGIFWYPWGNPASYTEWLKKDRYDENGNDRWSIVRYLSDVYMNHSESLYVDIVKPSNNVYFMDNELMSFSYPLIIGGITIMVDVSDNIDKVEFYIDNNLRYTDNNPPFSWFWSEQSFGIHNIKVLGYNQSGVYMDTLNVIRMT